MGYELWIIGYIKTALIKDRDHQTPLKYITHNP